MSNLLLGHWPFSSTEAFSLFPLLIADDFFKEELAKLLAVKVLFLELNLDLFVGTDFLFCLSHFFEEWMLQSLINGDSEVRVEHKNSAEKVDCIRSCSRIKL